MPEEITAREQNHKATPSQARESPSTKAQNEQAMSNELKSSQLGERLKFIRQRQGFSQRELARRADMTNGTLSNIEQGKVSPSVTSLEKILSAFPMSLQEFFSDQLDFSPAVFRRSDMVHIVKDDTEFHILPIKESGQESVYLAQQVYHPGARVKSEWLVRNGFVGGIVIEGELELLLEGVQYHITAGEGFYFALSRQHAFINSSKLPCTVVCVSFSQ